MTDAVFTTGPATAGVMNTGAVGQSKVVKVIIIDLIETDVENTHSVPYRSTN